jgi:hypothetical protein
MNNFAIESTKNLIRIIYNLSFSVIDSQDDLLQQFTNVKLWSMLKLWVNNKNKTKIIFFLINHLLT